MAADKDDTTLFLKALDTLIHKHHVALVWIGADLRVQAFTDNLTEWMSIDGDPSGRLVTGLTDELFGMEGVLLSMLEQDRQSFCLDLIERTDKAGVTYYLSLTFYPVQLDEQGKSLLLVCEYSRLAGTIRRLQQHYNELRLTQAELLGLATNDPLTRLGNRYALDKDLNEQTLSAIQSGRDVVVGMIDLDGLKAINDSKGHAYGDLLLQTYAKGLSANLRSDDRAYRMGGDEFVVVLPGARQADFDRLYQRIGNSTEFARQAGYPEASASVGLAALSEVDYIPAEAVHLADRRMYETKKTRHSQK